MSDGVTGDRRIINLGGEQFFVAPSSMSEARAGAVLPREGSEDARHILGAIDLPAADVSDSDEERDYGPDEAVEWVITVTFTGSPKLDPKKVSSLFDKQWREQHGKFTGYGRDSATGRWTYLIASNAPSAVTDVKLGWDYRYYDDQVPEATAAQYEQRLTEVLRVLSKLGDCHLQPSLAPSEAAKRASILGDLKRKYDQYAAISLAALDGTHFDGRALWDVMLCLGLKWGDMDCFHWDNHSDVGDQAFFSVQTSTPPGYFFPEELAAGRMKPADLVFLFSIPRSAAPRRVFDAMVRAIEYCQLRLGGMILDTHGKPADYDAVKTQIREIEEALVAAGFTPGSHAALRLF